ncbi:MAG: helix-turn-helix transcriptional regulator [Synergistaceae bacterium]|nr:helix-turn-helix transcriptional regulator [Synergistaceae bacterium]
MISYKKLWHLLLDKDLKKKDLVTLAGVSTYTISKFNRGDNVTTDVLQRICKALECNIGDIMDIVPDGPKNDGHNTGTAR